MRAKGILFVWMALAASLCWSCKDDALTDDAGLQLTAVEARQNVEAFLADFYKGAAVMPTVKDVVEFRVSDARHAPAGTPDRVLFYVANLDADMGFVLASADDRDVPVYGYVEEGRYDKSAAVGGFDLLIDNLVFRCIDADDTSLRRSQVQSVTATGDVAPLLATHWGTGSPYNLQLGGAPSSAVSTALAQVAAYYQRPGSFTYMDDEGIHYVELDWAAILSESGARGGRLSADDEHAPQVARFIGYLESPHEEDLEAVSTQALSRMTERRFYVGTSVTYALSDSDEDKNLCGHLQRNDLIYAMGLGRHPAADDVRVWLIDGCRSSFLHCNWGCDGLYDGYFLKSLLKPYTGRQFESKVVYCPIVG